MIIILDTSTIIAGLLSSRNNYTRYIFKLADLNKIEFAVSQETLLELKTVITSDQIKKYTSKRNHIIAPFINKYQHTSKIFKCNPKLTSSKLRDHNDNIFIQLASISKAPYLVTGDKDLLILKSLEKTLIVKPEEFVKLYTTHELQK